jgi:hypothetical protein
MLPISLVLLIMPLLLLNIRLSMLLRVLLIMLPLMPLILPVLLMRLLIMLMLMLRTLKMTLKELHEVINDYREYKNMNVKNLESLAAFLPTVDEVQFRMGNFNNMPVHNMGFKTGECGAVACAVGWAPNAEGLELTEADFWHDFGENEDETKFRGWAMYSDRLFDLTEIEWDWCFSGSWDIHDNTPSGAAARILMLLSKGSKAMKRLMRDVYEENLSSAMMQDIINDYREYLV